MKTLVPNYTFAPGGAGVGTITFDDYATIILDNVLLITNVTDNIIIYNFADTTKGGAAATNVLTLDFDTSAMDAADRLQIFYDDPALDTVGTDGSTGPAGVQSVGGTQSTGEIEELRVDSDGHLQVDVLTGTITPSGVQEIEGDEAEGAGLPNPVLIGGDDGTDIKNINVDATTGDVQVDVTNTVTVTGPLTDTELRTTPVPVSSGVTEGAGLPGQPLLMGGDDGANIKNIAVDSSGNVQTDVVNTVTVDGSGVTQPISAASLPLPSGAATSAAQLPDGHNVTVDNSTGASAVNIQDGGNVITVDHETQDAGLVDTNTQRVQQAYNDEWVSKKINRTSSTTNTILLQPGAGEKVCVKKCAAMVSNACTVDVDVEIGFGASAMPTTDDVFFAHPDFAPGSGLSEYYGEGGIIGDADEEVRVSHGAPTGGSIEFTFIYKFI